MGRLPSFAGPLYVVEVAAIPNGGGEEDAAWSSVKFALRSDGEQPTEQPAEQPPEQPAEQNREQPEEQPAEIPMEAPTEALTEAPTEVPTKATVGDKHGFGGSGQRVAIDNGTESAVLILLRDGLDNSVRIAIGIQVIESGQVNAADALSGIALGGEIVIGGELGTVQEGERRAIGGEEAVIGV